MRMRSILRSALVTVPSGRPPCVGIDFGSGYSIYTPLTACQTYIIPYWGGGGAHSL